MSADRLQRGTQTSQILLPTYHANMICRKKNLRSLCTSLKSTILQVQIGPLALSKHTCTSDISNGSGCSIRYRLRISLLHM